MKKPIDKSFSVCYNMLARLREPSTKLKVVWTENTEVNK
jgi:hypothetical protein